jgi:hypothetical protein
MLSTRRGKIEIAPFHLGKISLSKSPARQITGNEMSSTPRRKRDIVPFNFISMSKSPQCQITSNEMSSTTRRKRDIVPFLSFYRQSHDRVDRG